MALLSNLTHEELRALTEPHTYAASRAIMNIVNEQLSSLRKKNELTPKECPSDLRNDFRYIAGQIAAFRTIADLQTKARTEISKEDTHD